MKPASRHAPPPTPERGLTLLEAIAAAGVAAVAALGIVGLIFQMNERQKEAQAAQEIDLLLGAAEQYALAHWDFLKRSEPLRAQSAGYEAVAGMREIAIYDGSSATHLDGDIVPLGIVFKKLPPQFLEPFLPAGHAIRTIGCNELNSLAGHATPLVGGTISTGEHCTQARMATEYCAFFVSPYEEYFYQVYLFGEESTGLEQFSSDADNKFYAMVHMITPNIDTTSQWLWHYLDDSRTTISDAEKERKRQMQRIIGQSTRGTMIEPLQKLSTKSDANAASSRMQNASYIAMVDYIRYPCFLASVDKKRYDSMAAAFLSQSEPKLSSFRGTFYMFVAHFEGKIETIRRPVEDVWDKTIRADIEAEEAAQSGGTTP